MSQTMENCPALAELDRNPGHEPPSCTLRWHLRRLLRASHTDGPSGGRYPACSSPTSSGLGSGLGLGPMSCSCITHQDLCDSLRIGWRAGQEQARQQGLLAESRSLGNAGSRVAVGLGTRAPQGSAGGGALPCGSAYPYLSTPLYSSALAQPPPAV